MGKLFLGNAGKLAFSQVLRRLFRMATVLLAARKLGVATFGSYALILTVVEFEALISGAGYADFLTREVAKEREAAGALGWRIARYRVAWLLPTFLFVLLILRALGFRAIMVAVALMSVSVVPRILSECIVGITKGLGEFRLLPWLEAVQGAALVTVAAAMLAGGFGLKSVITAEIVSWLTGALFAMTVMFPPSSWKLSRRPQVVPSFRSLAAFNLYPFIASMYDRVDVVVLAKFAGNFATGVYSFPYRMYSALQIVPYGVVGSLLPGFSSLRADSAAQAKCARAMKFLYAVSLLIVLASIAFARPVILWLLGPEYLASAKTLNILVWASVPGFLNNALLTLLLAAAQERAFIRMVTVCTIFNIVMNIALVPRYSFYASAVVTVATELLLLFQSGFLAKLHFGRLVVPDDGTKITVGFVACLGTLVLLRKWVPEAWAGAAVFAMIGTAVVVWQGASVFNLWNSERRAH